METTDDIDMTTTAELEIAEATQRIPSKILLYGVEGIGKTTLASQFPDPLFIDLEGSTAKMKPQPPRLPTIQSYTDLKMQLKQVMETKHNYRTLIIDSLGWLESWIEGHVIAEANQKSIEDFGYGRGYKLVEERFGELFDYLDLLMNKRQMHIVLIAHSITRQATEPGSAAAFDRYELNLGKKVAPLAKQWVDAVLFANYKTVVVEGKGKPGHAIGGKERVLYCNHTAVIDAKNRFGLEDSIPMKIQSLKSLFE